MDKNETADGPPSTLDKAFVYALDHFIRIRGWTVQKFCQVSREKTPEKPLHPHMVTKWRAGLVNPSLARVRMICETLGVTRSFFFYVGERLAEFDDFEREPESRQQLRILHKALPELEGHPTDMELLKDIESVSRTLQERLARQEAERERLRREAEREEVENERS